MRSRRLGSIDYCNRTLIVKVIAENVVTCFLLGHSVEEHTTQWTGFFLLRVEAAMSTTYTGLTWLCPLFYFYKVAPDHRTNVRHAALFSAYLTVIIVELQRQLNFVVLRSVVNYPGRFAAATCNGDCLCLPCTGGCVWMEGHTFTPLSSCVLLLFGALCKSGMEREHKFSNIIFKYISAM